MINKHYRESALETYGEACELCGHRTSLEVHHIDYNEQWEMEGIIRKASKLGPNVLEIHMRDAEEQGYDEFRNNQLSKNDSTKNLAVLCGNCHSLCHLIDYGKKILKALKERK